MQLGPRAIKKLALHITGDSNLTRYRSGSMLVELFNRYGFDHEYSSGFPTRRIYAEDNIKEINGTRELKSLIEEIFDPLEFQEAGLDFQPALNDMNPYLERDGFQIISINNQAHVQETDGTPIIYSVSSDIHPPTSIDFISQQLNNCENRFASRDYRGAITSARSLCEQVLLDIEGQLCKTPPEYRGDLLKLNRHVGKLLNMQPEKYREQENVKQMLSGLISIINGLASMSNSMGDRHGGGIQPKKHHALLAINAANTFCVFLSDSFNNQNIGKNKDSNPIPSKTSSAATG